MRGESIFAFYLMHIDFHTDDARTWDAYVQAHPHASNYHQWAWKSVIEHSFQHRTYYLCAKQNGQIVGVLPLVLMQSLWFGRFLVSVPFLNYGGILADDTTVAQALLQAARELTRETQASHLELRHVSPFGEGLQVKQHKETMILSLHGNVEKQWKALDPKVRNQIRKAQHAGLQVESGGAEVLPDFYDVFARNMRDLGTPVYTGQFFHEILDRFPGTSKIYVIKQHGKAIAAGVTSTFRETLEMPWAASLREYRPLCANMLLYWEVIKSAILQKCQAFDFGRSTPGTGPARFKDQWKPARVPLAWEYWMPGQQPVPDITPHNARYKIAITMWQHMPVAVSKWLGPSLSRGIP